MEYNRIVAVTGMPGLYEILSSKNDGALVRSVEDQTTKFISSRIHNLSHLESIEIYTTGENVNLADVFNAMKSSSTKLPDVKDAKALKAYFEKVFPALDFERVYNSDMKKMVKWYETLNANGIEFKAASGEPQEEAGEEEAAPEAKAPAKAKAAQSADAGAETSEETDEAKPKKAPAKKKAAPKAEASADADTDGAEEKPKKKAAPKKKKDDTAE
ncbi:MAG: hypothetical protein EOO16_17430 [Chitinophagaceae bacterium]|nr:MAG: hypothetical protein EOO16_17430 [Chitinophagaceae bacterium]